MDLTRIGESADYSARFRLKKSLKNKMAVALIVNETDVENAVVLSTRKRERNRNYLIQVPANDLIEVRLDQIDEDSEMTVRSACAFRVIFDAPVLQNGALVDMLEVTQRDVSPDKVTNLYANCSYWNSSGYCRVKNLNGPAAGGTAVGWFQLDTWGPNDPNHNLLTVHYPYKGVPFHIDREDLECQFVGGIPVDTNRTVSLLTARIIDWENIGHTLVFGDVGKGTCSIALDPNYPCLVDTNGNNLPDTAAEWEITRN